MSSSTPLPGFLNDSLRLGTLVEFGMPWGKGGRAVILSFLAQATARQQWCLWVYDRHDLGIYPPAWAAMGIDLRYVRIAVSLPMNLLSDLKAVFMSSFFRVIVIDSHLKPQEYAFLARRARLQDQLILVLRNHFLTPRLGNIWAKTRFNCWIDPMNQRICLSTIKGRSKNQDKL